MGNKLFTEADRKATPHPRPLAVSAHAVPVAVKKISLERGVATRSKKNPGKRSRKGG